MSNKPPLLSIVHSKPNTGRKTALVHGTELVLISDPV